MKPSWHIVTGEYPNAPGGVSDYTRMIALALARVGERVTVWAPPSERGIARDAGVDAHALPDHFGLRTFGVLDQAFRAEHGKVRILLQYVPHIFGMRGVNLPFIGWLALRREPLWVMFHEVAFPIERGQALRHRVLAHATRTMARVMARRADRSFVSTESWTPTLLEFGARKPPTALPIPTTLPTEVEAGRVQEARHGVLSASLLGSTESTERTERTEPFIVGHFGTFGTLIAPLLEGFLEAFLSPSSPSARPRLALLVGRHAAAFAERVQARHPALRGLIVTREDLPAHEIAAHLAAADLLVQPFPDGATTRRTSLMAGLALGRPIVTNTGHLTERFWGDTGLAFADGPKIREIVRMAERVAADPELAVELGSRGRALYEERFSIEMTLAKLCQSTERAAPGVREASMGILAPPVRSTSE